MSQVAIADTSFLIDLLIDRGEAAGKLDELIEIGEPLWVPAISLHELYYGAGLHEASEREHERVRRLEQALPPVPFTAEAARLAGRIEAEMERVGDRPSRADVQIASIALARGEALVTADGGFEHIEGLSLESYER